MTESKMKRDVVKLMMTNKLLKEEIKRLLQALENIKNRAEDEESFASNATYGFACEIAQFAREALKGKEE